MNDGDPQPPEQQPTQPRERPEGTAPPAPPAPDQRTEARAEARAELGAHDPAAGEGATIELTVNGEERTVDRHDSLADLVETMTGDRTAKGIAVAINREVVPRSRWAARALEAGDQIEIVTAAQGG